LASDAVYDNMLFGDYGGMTAVYTIHYNYTLQYNTIQLRTIYVTLIMDVSIQHIINI